MTDETKAGPLTAEQCDAWAIELGRGGVDNLARALRNLAAGIHAAHALQTWQLTEPGEWKAAAKSMLDILTGAQP